MWKLLRNLALAAILVAGSLKLLAWYEVGQDAQRLVAAAAPYAQIHYDSIATGLDGSVTLGGVKVTVKSGPTPESYAADGALIETPGIFWLLKHALLKDDTPPAHLRITLKALKLPAFRWLDPQWLDPQTLVPFETAGCDTPAFQSGDYRKMGVVPGTLDAVAEYRYDPDGKNLDVDLSLEAAGFSKVTLDGELRDFVPSSFKSVDGVKTVHLSQLSLDYADAGYLQRRNQFCAARTNATPARFTEQHVSAVQGLLQQHGIEPGAEIVKLYRQLVAGGGHASVLSLPSGAAAAGALFSNPPSELLHQLNVTARYGDAPPVMFRMSFAPPPESQESAPAVAEAAGPTTTPAATASPSPPPPAATMPIAAATQTPTPAAAPPAVSAKPAALPDNLATPKPVPLTSAAAPPPSPKPAPSASERPAPASLGLDNIDREESKLPAPPKPAPNTATAGVQPSAPPPREGTTLALVWKPTMDRLPASAPEQRDYDVIDFTGLKNVTGRHVRLVTDGGKKVDGIVVSADENAVQLRVGGGAEFSLPRARVLEVELFRPEAPAG